MPRSHIDFYLFCRGLGYFGMPHIQLRFMAIESEDKIALSRRVATVWVVISMAVAVLIDLVGNAMTHSSVITSLSGNASETVIVRISDVLLHYGIPAAPAAASAAEKIDFSNVKIEPIFQEMVDFDTFAKADYRAVKIFACEAVPKSKKLLKFTLDDGERKDRVILSGIHEYYEPEELVGKTAIAIVNLPPRKMMGIDSEGMLISAVHEEDGHEGLNLLMVDDRIPAGAKLY